MNKTIFEIHCNPVWMLFSLVCVFVFAIPSVAQQEEMVAEMRQRQAKTLQTQLFMHHLLQVGFSSELQEELEVVDHQVESLKELAEDYQRDMVEFRKKNVQVGLEIRKLMKEGNNEEAVKLGEESQNRNKELLERYMEKAAEVLLPDQIKRLKKIAKRRDVKYMNQPQGEFSVVATVADEIGLSMAEKERLKAAIREARKEYHATVKEAKKKAQEKILATLTPEQLENLKEIFGEDYVQDAMPRKSRTEMMEEQR